MQVILLEKVRNLGGIGEQVNVRAGYARNYLIPKEKAALVTKVNLAQFEQRRADLEKASAEKLQHAKERAALFANLEVIIPVKVSEEGKLFGSVGLREIMHALEKIGHTANRNEISLPNGSIRQIGEHEVTLLLHTDVTAPIKIKVVAE